jgi:pimeloyl-ACP methyl ester carboxylesterase
VWIQSARMDRRPDLPDQDDDATLWSILAEGRPQGDKRILPWGGGKREVVVDGFRCPLIRAGAGRPLLFVHGLGHDSWDWAPLFSRFVQRNTCVAIDMPGFGFADKPEKLTLQMMVDALFAAAETCGEPPIVIASSLGGHVALLAALERPQRFAAMVLLATGGLVVVPPLLQDQLRRYYSVDAICSRSEHEIINNSRRIFVGAHPMSDALVRRKLAVHRSNKKLEFAKPFSSIVDDVFRFPVRDRLRGLRVPSLFVSGARDVVVPHQACREGAEESGNRFVLLDDAGHCPHLETPDRVAHEIESFMSSAFPMTLARNA